MSVGRIISYESLDVFIRWEEHVLRKNAAVLSIMFVIISLIPLLLAMVSDFFSEYMFIISVISYFLAITFALMAKKGQWKTAALTLLALMTIAVIGFYAFMGIFWNQP